MKKHFKQLGTLRYEIIKIRSIDVGEGQQLDYWEAKKKLTKIET